MDENLIVKFSNFTYASSFKEGNLQGAVGDCKTPEMHANISYSGKEVDIFQIGVCLFNMVTNMKPFGQAIPTDKFYRLIAGSR